MNVVNVFSIEIYTLEVRLSKHFLLVTQSKTGPKECRLTHKAQRHSCKMTYWGLVLTLGRNDKKMYSLAQQKRWWPQRKGALFHDHFRND